MKKIILIIFSMLLMLVLKSSYISNTDINKVDVDTVTTDSVYYKKVTIKLDKDKKFANDYTRTYKGVKIIVRKGTAWDQYVKLKNAIDNIPPFGKSLVKKVILSTSNPVMELIQDKNLAAQAPDAAGITDSAGNIAIRDYTGSDVSYMSHLDNTLYHEMTHNLIDQNKLLPSEEVSKLYKATKKQAKENYKRSKQYVDLILQYDSDEHEFLSDIVSIYVAGADNDSPAEQGHIDYDYFKKTYPAAHKFAENFVNEANEKYGDKMS